MAVIAVQSLSDAGTAPTFATPGAADTVQYGNGNNTFVVVRNTHATVATTVTLDPAGKTDYNKDLPNNVVTVPALTGEVWIPLRRDYDNGAGTGSATLGISGGTFTVALIRVG